MKQNHGLTIYNGFMLRNSMFGGLKQTTNIYYNISGAFSLPNDVIIT